MKIVFCIDDNPRYLMLARVAVRSLRRLYGEDVPVLCVYGGAKPEVIEAVEAERIPLALYTPVLNHSMVPAAFHRAIGAFLKLELALVPELADEEYVLYCDSDMYFHARFDELLAMQPAYMAMAREASSPFWHEIQQMKYVWREKEYTVPLPFPIWTYSSGVVNFNLGRLRKHDHIHNFLAFCLQNVHHIGNLDQSLLNYFFGKRITKLPPVYNCPPYRSESRDTGCLIHFHGPKPWDIKPALWKELRINHYSWFRDRWFALLTPQEAELVHSWE
ncbi:glycosyl transferase [Desulfovibrio mangrovi]|uniref:glycosyltransferase family 8 protein n=1 Tax=Desulfovibrio mangrovi TaxID=2976983 RepID=UPI00224529B0|nr:glycosyltransferase [Desulfovibrio mangrovi]UZP67006.1 glycosyl transferase [Desulfovibrio mangrovi]